MKGKLNKIGNSKVIIIPVWLLEEFLIKEARSGWAEAFAKADTANNEMLIDDALANDFDEQGWTW